MAVTETSICNSALIKVGAQRITSLLDDSEQARLVKEQYEKNRDALLYAHPWNFAIKRVALSADVTPPEFGWGNRFQLPSDVLRVIETDQEPLTWQVEGRYLMSDASALKIKYISQITDTSKFSSLFSEMLALKIAHDIAYSITQNASLSMTILQEYEMKLREARSFDAQESRGDKFYTDTWLNARF